MSTRRLPALLLPLALLAGCQNNQTLKEIGNAPAMSPIGSRNSEWIVCPSTFSAATPVGAQTAICFCVFQARCCSSVDFPVPARPVTNTCSRVSSMRRNSSSCSGDRSGMLTATC